MSDHRHFLVGFVRTCPTSVIWKRLESRTVYNKVAYVGVFVIVAATTLLYGTVHQAVISLAYLMIFMLLMFLVTDFLRSGALKLSLEPLQLVIYSAGIFGLIQIIPFAGSFEAGGINAIPGTISMDPFATQVSALHFLVIGIYFSIVLTMFDSAQRLRKFAIFITVFGAAYGFFAILQSLLSPDKIYGLLERPYAQPFGSFVSRNNFAVWMEMAIALPMGLLFTEAVSKDKRLIFITAITIMGVSLILCGSRGGLVALLVQLGFLLFLTYSRRKRSSTWLKVALAGGLLIAIMAGIAFVGGESTLTRLSEEHVETPNAVTRPVIWGVTMRMITENQPFGVGLGAYGVAYTKYDAASGFERVEQAHNDYLQVLSDGGIVGGILGLIFLALLIRTGVRAVGVKNQTRRGIAVGALTGIFGVLVHSLFDFGLHTMSIAILFLTLLAVLVAAGSKYEDDESDEPNKRERRHRRA